MQLKKLVSDVITIGFALIVAVILLNLLEEKNNTVWLVTGSMVGRAAIFIREFYLKKS